MSAPEPAGGPAAEAAPPVTDAPARFALADSPEMPSMLNPSHRDAYLAEDEDEETASARLGHGDPLARARKQHAEYVEAMEREAEDEVPPPLSLGGGRRDHDDNFLTSSPPTSYPSVFMSPPSRSGGAGAGAAAHAEGSTSSQAAPLAVTPVRKKRLHPTSTPVSILNEIRHPATDRVPVARSSLAKSATSPAVAALVPDAAASMDARPVFSNFTGVPHTRGQEEESGNASANTSRGNSRGSDGKLSQRSTSSSTSTVTGEEENDDVSDSGPQQSTSSTSDCAAFRSSPIQTSPMRSPRSSGSSKSVASANSSPMLSFNIPPPLPLISQALLPVRNNPPMTGVVGRPDTLPCFRHVEWSPKEHEMCLELGESSLSQYFPALKLSEELPPSSAETKPTWGSPDNRKRRGSGSDSRSTARRAPTADRKSFYYSAPVTVYARPDALRQIDRWNHRMEIALNEAADTSGPGGGIKRAERTGTADSSSSNESSKAKEKKQKTEKGEGDRNDKDVDRSNSLGSGPDESEEDVFLKNKIDHRPSAGDDQQDADTSPRNTSSPPKKKRRRKRLRRRPPGYIKLNSKLRKNSPVESSDQQRSELPLDAVPKAPESRHVDPSSVPDLSLTFDSQFESGNLLRAQLVGAASCKSRIKAGKSKEKKLKMGVQEFDLVLQNDLFTNGHVQWCDFPPTRCFGQW